MQSDGSPWRPFAHVEDIARGFLAALEAPREAIHNEAFNIGRDEDNHQIRDVARMIEATVPGATVTLADGAGPDTRTYRVSFAKVAERPARLRSRSGRSSAASRSCSPPTRITTSRSRTSCPRASSGSRASRSCSTPGALDPDLRWRLVA